MNADELVGASRALRRLKGEDVSSVDAKDLLDRLRASGATVSLEANGRIFLKPLNALSPELLAEVKAHRDDLSELLGYQGPAIPPLPDQQIFYKQRMAYISRYRREAHEKYSAALDAWEKRYDRYEEMVAAAVRPAAVVHRGVT